MSKCYGIIERFSEDIDLMLDWRVLGYGIDEPWAQRSKTQQDKFNKSVNRATVEYLRNTLVPRMKADFSDILSDEFDVYIQEGNEEQTVCFSYPRIFSENAIINVVRLEIGALAAWTPSQWTKVAPYAAEIYPHIFHTPSTEVLTVTAERTFWEKVTIAHREAFREGSKFPLRYSRHFYDLYKMDNTAVKTRAYADLVLLDKVVTFKQRFYPVAAARYDLAKPGTIRLVPPEESMSAFASDFTQMRNMIFGDIPDFSEIIACLRRMEDEINSLS